MTLALHGDRPQRGAHQPRQDKRGLNQARRVTGKVVSRRNFHGSSLLLLLHASFAALQISIDVFPILQPC